MKKKLLNTDKQALQVACAYNASNKAVGLLIL